MASRVEIEFQIKAENAKIRALEADMRGLTRSVEKTTIANGRLTKEQKEAAAAAKYAAVEAKAQHRQRVADLTAELGLQRRQKMANLGVGLSILFAGQAIKRFSEQALRGLINTYAEVMGKSSTFGIITNRLAASWEFLKYSIMDALEQSGLLERVIGWAQWLTDKFIALPDSVKAFGAAVLGLAWVAGTIMSPIGQIITAMSADWSQLVANVKSMGPALSKMAGTVAILYAFKQANDALDAFSSGAVAEGIFNSLSAGFLAVGGYRLLKGKGGGWLIVLGIALDRAANKTLVQDAMGLAAALATPFIIAADLIIWSWKKAKAAMGRGPDPGKWSPASSIKSVTQAMLDAGKATDKFLFEVPTPTSPQSTLASQAPTASMANANFNSASGGPTYYVQNAYLGPQTAGGISIAASLNYTPAPSGG